MSFHPKILGVRQRKALRLLGPLLGARQFYLGGGTAVALHLGHRHSVDLDWFKKAPLADPLGLAQKLRDAGVSMRTIQVDEGTLHGCVFGVRVSLLEYHYSLLDPLVSWFGGRTLLASLADLAAMKLAAVAQRGSKKDFVDIFALGLQGLSLQQMLRWYQQKYAVEEIGHVLYGLNYFDDADKERMPRMIWRKPWSTIKKTIREWVKDFRA